MTLRRASLILPCPRLDDFPSHLTGGRAAELLAGWTALWHPTLIDALGRLPAWRAADDLPDPSEFDGELLLFPEASTLRMSADWRDRLRTANPNNPAPVDVDNTRQETIAGVLLSAGIDGSRVRPELVGDFLALGLAYLQVELLTRAMHYSTVLDTDRFENAAVTAARAALANDEHLMREELARAFDLLADARNHVYAVDFFVVDITLLASSTLGDSLRAKLASRFPTSLLCPGELLDELASQHPQTSAELRRAMDAGTACVIGGTFHQHVSRHASPEQWLDEITLGQAAARRHLERDYEVFGLFHSQFSPLLPDVLRGAGFKGALHASFDGGRFPRAEQSKTWWGPSAGRAIPALAVTPLDASRPETWLKLGEKIGDTIAHDHVATVLFAGWPDTRIEYYEDLRRAAQYGPVLGKLVTLEEYFRVSREPDEWTRFHTREYPLGLGTEPGPNPISSPIDVYRQGVSETYQRLSTGLAAVLDATAASESKDQAARHVVINPWNFPCTQLHGVTLTELAPPLHASYSGSGATGSASAGEGQLPSPACCLPDVSGWGYATFAAAAPLATIPLVEGYTLRNERLEVTVSEVTGGIQSIRGYRDRNTRLSQRLAFHRGRIASAEDSKMVAERVAITRNDALLGEIESRGRLLDSNSELLATFVQRVRIARGVPAVFVEVELDPKRQPEGDIWRSYYCSRLAWGDDAISVRRGGNWMAYESGRERIESPEWIEINDGVGTVTCFAFGLPYHRRASPSWLDTLLVVAGESRRQFQFALALVEGYPSRNALGLITASHAPVVALPSPPPRSRGWFLHVGAKNIVATHLDRLAGPPAGIRVRLIETEGRETHTSLTAYRPFTAARITDFRGNSTAVLSIVDGRVEFNVGPHQWIQIEAEW
jgi:alpha-mannosidase